MVCCSYVPSNGLIVWIASIDFVKTRYWATGKNNELHGDEPESSSKT